MMTSGSTGFTIINSHPDRPTNRLTVHTQSLTDPCPPHNAPCHNADAFALRSHCTGVHVVTNNNAKNHKYQLFSADKMSKVLSPSIASLSHCPSRSAFFLPLPKLSISALCALCVCSPCVLCVCSPCVLCVCALCVCALRVCSLCAPCVYSLCALRVCSLCVLCLCVCVLSSLEGVDLA
jgi:hypothetical protein